MDILLIILAFFCIFGGIAGSVLPAIPGPPLAYFGLLLARWGGLCDFSVSLMVWTGIIMMVVTIADYVLPPYITRSSGGSRYATTGTVVGMIVGIFLTPVGMVAGMLLGAFIGELVFAKQTGTGALKAALGAFAGFLMGTGIKLIYCFALLFFVIRALIT